MSLVLKFVVLGIVQGLTEFLPVSSDGHLAVAEHFLGIGGHGEDNLAVTVALHFGTLVAVVLYLWKDIVALLRGLFAPGVEREERRANWKLALAIIVCCIPAGFFGIRYEKKVEAMTDSLLWAGGGFLVTAICLFVTRYAKANAPIGEMTYGRAFLIGCAQVFALAPGISRSGTTISSGMLLGYTGQAAGRFSFLMAIPIIAGAIVFKVKDILELPRADMTPLIVGVVVSFVTGLFALWLLDLLLKRGRVHAFAWYLVPLAAFTVYAGMK